MRDRDHVIALFNHDPSIYHYFLDRDKNCNQSLISIILLFKYLMITFIEINFASFCGNNFDGFHQPDSIRKQVEFE